MKKDVSNNNSKLKPTEITKDYTPQELLLFLLQDIGCESIEENIRDTEAGQIQGYNADIENESVSMFFVKNEEEFLALLGLGGKENTNG